MADTYSQIFYHVVFAVRNRQSLISPNIKDDLYKYITGIIQNKGQKLIAINWMPDHIHIFIGMKPNCNLSDLVREIKKASNSYINDKKLKASNFQWQEGFGAFSYSQSQINNVVKYINNQKKHHTKQTFKEEYLDFLKKFSIEYDEKYLFEWFDNN